MSWYRKRIVGYCKTNESFASVFSADYFLDGLVSEHLFGRGMLKMAPQKKKIAILRTCLEANLIELTITELIYAALGFSI